MSDPHDSVLEKEHANDGVPGVLSNMFPDHIVIIPRRKAPKIKRSATKLGSCWVVFAIRVEAIGCEIIGLRVEHPCCSSSKRHGQLLSAIRNPTSSNNILTSWMMLDDVGFLTGWWFGTLFFYFSIQLGSSSSQLTNLYFSEG